MNRLTDRIVINALAKVGVRESAFKDGPGEISEWLKRVNRSSSDRWSTAFAWCMLDDACKQIELHNFIDPCASVHLLMAFAREKYAWTDNDVAPGYIFGIDNGCSGSYRLGHCGVIIEADLSGLCRTVEGPEDLVGCRKGDRVATKTRCASEFTLGCLDPGKLFA